MKNTYKIETIDIKDISASYGFVELREDIIKTLNLDIGRIHKEKIDSFNSVYDAIIKTSCKITDIVSVVLVENLEEGQNTYNLNDFRQQFIDTFTAFSSIN